MAGSGSDQQNPYASPKSRLEGAALRPSEEDRELFVIDPKLRARDAIDVLLGIASVSLVMSPLIAAISLATYWVWGPQGVGMFVYLAVVSIALLFFFPELHTPLTLSYLTIDASGIAFRRLFGRPRFLPWEAIRAIRPATRAEVFVHAWLRPLRLRDPTATRTARGHYRIEWSGGYLYFPPRDPGQFVTAVRRFRPDLLRENSAH